MPNCLSLRCAVCWFHMLQYNYRCVLANTSTMSRNYPFFFVVRTIAIWPLGCFEVSNAVPLNVITTLCISSLELAESLYPEILPSHFPQPLVTTILWV